MIGVRPTDLLNPVQKHMEKKLIRSILVNRSRKVRWKILIGDLALVPIVVKCVKQQDTLCAKTNNAEILGEEGQIVDHKKRET
jgi:hypothetical protein